jgi:hypothetical protein
MKKLFSYKILIFIFVIALSMSLFAACSEDVDDVDDVTLVDDVDVLDDVGSSTVTATIPDFSLTAVDYGEEIDLTDDMFASCTFYDISRTKSDVTTYYKGLKISEVLPLITEIENQDAITSLQFVATDGYGADIVLPQASFATCYIAVLECDTQDGSFEAISTDDGPTRIIDMSDDGIKSIKNLSSIYVNRTLDFDLTIIDGETSYTFTEEDVASLSLTSYVYTKTKDDVTYTTNYKGYSLSAILEAKGIDTTGITNLSLLASDDTDATIDLANISTAIFTVYTFDTVTYDSEDIELLSILDTSDGPIRAFCDEDSVNLKQTISVTISR